MGDLGPRPFRLGVALALLGLCFAVTAPALDGAILGHDDEALLTGPRGALQKPPLEFFTGLHFEAYLPVYGLTLRLDGALGAGPGETFLLHFQNVLWHAAASYLVFCLLGLLLRHRGAAVLGAILFALHPLHAESVAWISSRKDVVSGALLFLAWLFALKGEERHPGWTAAAVLVFLLACFAKASAVVLPVLLVAAALLLPRYAGRRREAALLTWPFWAAAAAPLLVHVLVGIERGVVREGRGITANLVGLVAAWGGFVKRAVLPLDLSVDYPEAGSTALPDLWLPAGCLVAAAAAFVALRRRAPVAAFGIAAFFAALLPFNNVFPATDVVLASDRYAYLPLFGFAVLAAWAAARWRPATVALGVTAAAFGVLFGIGAARFRDDETLWTKTLEARPASALAHISRGIGRLTRGMQAEPKDPALLRGAVEDFRKGLARATLKENRLRACRGLVQPLLALGEVDEALERADQALALLEGREGRDARQWRSAVLFDRACVYRRVGEAVAPPEGRALFARAAADFEASAKEWSYFEAWSQAGRMHVEAGNLDAGRRALEKAAELDPTQPEPSLNLARVWRVVGEREAAERALDDALRRARGGPFLADVVRERVAFWLERDAPDHLRARRELAHLPAHLPQRDRLAAEVDAAEALYLFRRGDAAGALVAADRAREAAGRQSGASGAFLAPLAAIYTEAGRYDDAAACARAGDVLGHDPARRNAVARAYAMKAAALLEARPADAARAMRAALDERPEVIEAGGAALRGVLEDLRGSDREGLLLLGAAAAAGDRAQAVRIGESLLAGDLPPRDRVLALRLRGLARAWSANPDFEGAQDDLHQVLARDPKDLWGRYRLAQVWTLMAARQGGGEGAQELLDRAERLLTEVMADQPSFPWARLQRGEVRFARDDIIGAKQDYEELRRQGFDRKEVCLKEAVLHRLVYVKGGDALNLAKADELLRRAEAQDPNSYDVLFELGNVHHHLFDRDDASGDARMAAFAEALKWYRRAKALDPRRRAARHEWARICLKVAEMSAANGRLKAAWDLVAQVESEAADIGELWKAKLRLVLRSDFGDATRMGPDACIEAADGAMDRLETLVPDDPEMPALRALWHRSKGYLYYTAWAKFSTAGPKAKAEPARRMAAAEFRRAYEAWPEDPENGPMRDRLAQIAPEELAWVDRRLASAAYGRGLAAYDRGDWDTAAAAFAEASERVPEWTEMRFRLAMALVRAGRTAEARPHLERVANAADGGDYPEAYSQLGDYYLRRASPMDRHIARTWFERFVEAMEKKGLADDERTERARRLLRDLVPE